MNHSSAPKTEPASDIPTAGPEAGRTCTNAAGDVPTAVVQRDDPHHHMTARIATLTALRRLTRGAAGVLMNWHGTAQERRIELRYNLQDALSVAYDVLNTYDLETYDDDAKLSGSLPSSSIDETTACEQHIQQHIQLLAERDDLRKQLRRAADWADDLELHLERYYLDLKIIFNMLRGLSRESMDRIAAESSRDAYKIGYDQRGETIDEAQKKIISLKAEWLEALNQQATCSTGWAQCLEAYLPNLNRVLAVLSGTSGCSGDGCPGCAYCASTYGRDTARTTR
ncbi:MAG: hypothetical protein J2P19_15720 [Pseudonocardia sp.]|nr:hypothetical protein [Pseudonocardia sp.]